MAGAAVPSLATRRGWNLSALQIDASTLTFTDDSQWDASQRPWASFTDPKLLPVFHRLPLHAQLLAKPRLHPKPRHREHRHQLPVVQEDLDNGVWVCAQQLSTCSSDGATINATKPPSPQLAGTPTLNNFGGMDLEELVGLRQ